MHTIFSDGTCTLEDIFEIASSKKLAAISITDHDTTEAYPEAISLGSRIGIDVISGVEFSSSLNGKDIHILGYGIDVHNLKLQELLQKMRDERVDRIRKMVQLLNNIGVDIRFETVQEIAGNGTMGRPHLAAALVKEELCYSFREAFDKYLGYDCPAYVEKFEFHPFDAFELIHEVGGVAVLAHPAITKVDEHIASFVEHGLDGIEVYYSSPHAANQSYYAKLCRKYGLLQTGGSDFHHPHNRNDIGNVKISYKLFETLLEAIEAKKGINN